MTSTATHERFAAIGDVINKTGPVLTDIGNSIQTGKLGKVRHVIGGYIL